MIKTTFLAFVGALMLLACAQTVPGRPMPRFDFLTRPVVPILVSNVKVVNAYTPVMASPNVDHLFNVTLEEAVQHWADRRFSPRGSDGTLTVTIEEASVIEEPLQRTEGIQGLFTLDQAYRYKATLIVSLASTPLDHTASEVSTRATIEHSRTVGEYASVQDRDAVWTLLTQDVMHDLDLYLTKSMREKLPFLIR